MKNLVFDTSSVITLVTNNLLDLLMPLKSKFKGDFFIPKSVEYELVDKPLQGKMFKLEALIVRNVIKNNLLKTYSDNIDVDSLLNQINSMFIMNDRPIILVSKAEVEALALAINLQSSAYVVDERTMRLLIEDPIKLKKLQERKLHNKIRINKDVLNEFSKYVKNVKVIRSTELMLIAYEFGLMDKYLVSNTTNEDLLDALLWGLKLRGCAISQEEVDSFIELEK
ncbi:hypothetical protein J4440_03700 [Candidatus Woesearchaeota archaeon]|nr:hypothetical protein [Candidatus Woesearchaeota archaeon]